MNAQPWVLIAMVVLYLLLDAIDKRLRREIKHLEKEKQ